MSLISVKDVILKQENGPSWKYRAEHLDQDLIVLLAHTVGRSLRWDYLEFLHAINTWPSNSNHILTTILLC